MLDSLSRRQFSARLTSLLGVGLLDGDMITQITASRDDVTKTSEAIHQEVTFAASARRIYQALTDAAEFTKVTAFSSVKNAPPAHIEALAGGTFSLFGGHIVGRQVELVPAQRLVQAWRVVDWTPGIFSIAKFSLVDHGGKSTLVFDHTGFPNGLGDHLARGWRTNYWEPLAKYLG